MQIFQKVKLIQFQKPFEEYMFLNCIAVIFSSTLQIHHHRQSKFLFKAFSKGKLQQLHYNDIQASEVTLITELNQDSPNPCTSGLTQLGEQAGFPSFYLLASCSIYCQHTMSQINHIQGSPVAKFCPLEPGNLSFGQKQLQMTKRCFYPHKLNVNCHFSKRGTRTCHSPPHAHFTLTA